MDTAIRKAETLIEALSYIRQFRNRLIVIKLGGSAMEEPDALKATLQDVIFMATVGLRPIVVHGGGKPIDRAMAESGLKPRKVLGRRYTDDETLAIVVRVLLKEINVDLEKQVRHLGGRAIGPHLGSLQFLFGEKLMLPGPDGQPIDLGRVGKVTRVDANLLRDCCEAGIIPLIPSLALGRRGGLVERQRGHRCRGRRGADEGRETRDDDRHARHSRRSQQSCFPFDEPEHRPLPGIDRAKGH